MQLNQISDAIKQSISDKQCLQIIGAGSKLEPTINSKLSLKGYNGIISYQPSELVITVKAGTPLNELQQILAEKNQMLCFEPPDYGNSTIGGTYACGLSGPAQPFRGSLRDYVLGVKIISGQGQILNFGGEMMKNVAGYDVSRLLTGSRGNLAVIAEISFKVLPMVEEQTYCMEMSQQEAIHIMNQWAGTSMPLSACAWYQDTFYYRLFGSHDKQSATEADNSIWKTLNPFQPDMKNTQPLWRASVASTEKPLDNTLAVDWCGSRRWIASETKPDLPYVGLWKNGMSDATNHPQIEKGLKTVFDPHHIFRGPNEN